jgi:fatty-acyl-CoA synthase
VSGWNYADVWEVVADVLPDAPALVHGELRRSWRDFDRRADALAAWLLDCGLGRGDTVGQELG